MKHITKIRVSDGGDGSTIFRFWFDDGTTGIKGPDVPYDGYTDITFNEDGTMTETSVDDGDPNEGWE